MLARLLIIIVLALGCFGCETESTKSTKEKCAERIASDGGYNASNPVHRACIEEMAK